MTRSGARPASVAAMTTSLLTDALEHHTWATERLLDACTALTDEQLDSVVPGTYGSIIATLRQSSTSEASAAAAVLNEALDPLLKAGLRGLESGDFMSTHWLASFAWDALGSVAALD